MTSDAALHHIRTKMPDAAARVGLILGSGLGGLAGEVEGVRFTY